MHHALSMHFAFLLIASMAVSGCSRGHDRDGDEGASDASDASAQSDASTQDDAGDAAIPSCDEDGDGHLAIRCQGDDCDDTSAFAYPGAPPTCGTQAIDDCDARITPFALNLFDGQTAELEVGMMPARRVKTFETRMLGLVPWKAHLALVGVETSTDASKFYLAGIASEGSFTMESALVDPTDVRDRASFGVAGRSTIALGVLGDTLESITLDDVFDPASPTTYATFSRVAFVQGDDPITSTSFSSNPPSDDDTYFHFPNAVFATPQSGNALGWVYPRMNGNSLSDRLVRCTGAMSSCASTGTDGVIDTVGQTASTVEIVGTGGPYVFGRSNVGSPRVFAWNAFTNDAIAILLDEDLALTPTQTLGNRIGAALIGEGRDPAPYLLAIPTSEGLVVRRVECNTVSSGCVGVGTPFVVRGTSAHRDATITRIDTTHFAIASIAEANGTSQVYFDIVDETGAFQLSIPIAIDAELGELADVSVAYLGGDTARGPMAVVLIAIVLRKPSTGTSEIWVSALAACVEK